MKEFMGVIQEEDLYLTEPLPKDIGGRVCTRKPRNTLRSVINARDLLRTSTNQEGSLILSPVRGRLLSEAWIL